jgi:hypothetical protein
MRLPSPIAWKKSTKSWNGTISSTNTKPPFWAKTRGVFTGGDGLCLGSDWRVARDKIRNWLTHFAHGSHRLQEWKKTEAGACLSTPPMRSLHQERTGTTRCNHAHICPSSATACNAMLCLSLSSMQVLAYPFLQRRGCCIPSNTQPVQRQSAKARYSAVNGLGGS